MVRVLDMFDSNVNQGSVGMLRPIAAYERIFEDSFSLRRACPLCKVRQEISWSSVLSWFSIVVGKILLTLPPRELADGSRPASCVALIQPRRSPKELRDVQPDHPRPAQLRSARALSSERNRPLHAVDQDARILKNRKQN